MSELSPREKRSIDELYDILAGYRRQIDRIARAQDTRLTTLRAGDGAGLTFVDDDGKPLLQFGGRGAGINGDLIKYLDGPVPEAPGEPLITGGAGVIHVTLGDGAEPSDAKLCRVHASLESDFEPSAGTMIGSVQPGHRSVSLSIQAGTWYCCVQWLTLSGKESEVSPIVSVDVDAMVDMSDLDDARAEADEKWADFAEREAEYQAAIADAQARIEAAEELFELLPEPSDLETAVQQAKDAIEALGDVSQRLQDAEAALGEKASTAELNNLSGHMEQLDQDLSNARARLATAESTLAPLPGQVTAAQQAATNAATAASDAQQAALDAAGIAEGKGQVIVQASAPTGSRASSANLWVRSTDQKVHTYNGTSWVAVTDPELISAAQEAQQAKDAADAAQGKADILELAMDGEGGLKDRLSIAEGELEDKAEKSELDGLDGRLNDTRLGMENLRDVRLPQLQDSLNAGLADASQWRDVGAISSKSLAITDFENVFPEQQYWATGVFTRGVFNAPNGTTQRTVVSGSSELANPNGIIFDAAATNDLRYTGGQQNLSGAGWIDHEPGAQYRIDFKMQVHPTASQSAIPNSATIGQFLYDWVSADGTYTFSGTPMVTHGPNGNAGLPEANTGTLWSIRSGSMVVNPRPNERGKLRFLLSGRVGSAARPHVANLRFFDVRIRRMNAGRLLVDGSVQARHIMAEEVAAAVGQFLKLSVEDLNADELWAALAVIDRLQAVSGWIGGTSLADGAVTTEKITATREMITKILGADRAFVNEELVVKGNLFADNAEIISAAMKTLTVTEKASFAEAFAQEIWAKLGVFERLEATEGWVGGVNLENGAVTAEKITVTSQLITKILGVETAVADVLVANVELWARSATIIAATMGNLTVTEKANFVDAFADSFMSNSAIIRELLASRLVVSAENFAPDPGKVPEVWDFVGADVVSNSNSATGNAIRLARRSGDTQVRGPMRPVRPGDTIRFKGYYLRSGSGSSVGQPVQLRMEWSTDPKASTTTTTTFHTMAASAWSQTIEAEVVVPDGVTWGRLYIYQASTSGPAVAQFYGDMDVRPLQGGELLVDGSVQARKLQADEIWANSTWQGEAHFGAEDATYRTLINGQGVEVYQKGESTDEGTSAEVPVVQLGTGGDNAFSALMDGEVVGGIGQDGTVTGARVISADDALVAGYPVFGKLLSEEIPSRGDSWSLLDQLPRGVVAFGSRNMNGVTWNGLGGQGFLELSFDGIWDRQYRLNIHPWQMSGDKNYFQRVVIRYDGNAPGITDVTGTGVQVWNTSAPFGGSYLLSPNNGTVRVLIGVYTGNNGLTYSSTLSNVHAWIEDVGSRVESSGLDRHSTLTYGSGGGETGGGNSGVTAKKSYHSAWTPSWMRSFMSGGGLYQTRGKGAAELRQGRDRYWTAGGIQTSAFGGFTSSAIAGETSRTISSALSGATLDSGSIELRGSYVPGGGSAVVRLHWHTLSSMPGSYTSTANHIGDYTITAGGSRRIALPASVRTAIKNGTFGGFGLNPRGSTSQQYALGVSWNVRPVLRLKYTR